jgi:hypothetical protein
MLDIEIVDVKPVKKKKAMPGPDEVNHQLSLADAAAEMVIRKEAMGRLSRLCDWDDPQPSEFAQVCRMLFKTGEISRKETVIDPDGPDKWCIQLPTRIWELRHKHGFKDVLKTVPVKLASGKKAFKYVLTYYGHVEEIEGRTKP